MDTARPRRSALYMPASNARAIEKAKSLPCDVVILDLEDAVAPDMKAAAREQALAAIRDGGFGRRELVVRVNGLETPWGRDDLAAFAGSGVAAILAPKVSDARDVEAYDALLTGPTRLWVMIETCRALFNLAGIADRGGGLTGIAGVMAAVPCSRSDCGGDGIVAHSRGGDF